MCTAPLFVARRRAAAEGFTLIEGSCFAASPAGTTNRADYEFMRDEILSQLKAALPLDGVLFGLHGAMVAHGYDDVEGDVLERARAIVGPDCVIGVELDPHCHLTVKRVRLADITILYKEFPHTDVVERAEDLLTLVLRTIRKEIRPTTSLFDCRQIGSYPTTLPLMRGFVDRTAAMEGKDGVLSVSIGHCFPYADVPELTGRILVITDNDKAKADRLASEIGQEFVAMRGRTAPDYLRLRCRHQRGAGVQRQSGCDGGSGRQCRRRRAERQHHDPASDDGTRCGQRDTRPDLGSDRRAALFRRRPGARFPLRFGGKIGPTSGQPIDATVTVVGLKRDCWQSFGPTQVPLGDCAAIRVGGVEVVLISNRTQALGLELFRNLGIEPTERKLVVVKSTNHFMAAFGPIAQKVIYVDSDGPLSRDYRTIGYTRIAARSGRSTSDIARPDRVTTRRIPASNRAIWVPNRGFLDLRAAGA